MMLGYGPPGTGPGVYDNDVTNETYRMKHQDAANARLANEARGKRNKGIFKLMQSGTPLGKFVKFLYRAIVDLNYR